MKKIEIAVPPRAKPPAMTPFNRAEPGEPFDIDYKPDPAQDKVNEAERAVSIGRLQRILDIVGNFRTAVVTYDYKDPEGKTKQATASIVETGNIKLMPGDSRLPKDSRRPVIADFMPVRVVENSLPCSTNHSGFNTHAIPLDAIVEIAEGPAYADPDGTLLYEVEDRPAPAPAA